MNNTDERLVWLDLETTGLDPREGCILEVACIITDNDLVEVDCFESLVHTRKAPTYPHDRLNHKVDCEPFTSKFVLEMHEKNGLWSALNEAEPNTTAWRPFDDVARDLAAFISDHTPNRRFKHPLCGSTISFDRAWLIEHMPEVNDAVHYRNIDVSTLMGLCQRWRPDLELPPKGGAHRALADIRDSIRFLKFYREHFIRTRTLTPDYMGTDAELSDNT